MNLPTLDQANPEGKICLTRVDFNVPLSEDGTRILDDFRLRSTLPTVRELTEQSAKVVLITHIGRPKGKVVPNLGVETVRREFERLLGSPIGYLGAIREQTRQITENLQAGGVAIAENLRFDVGEEQNDQTLAQKMASIADIYVNDAFAASHRRHASVDAVARLLPSYVGRLLQTEVEGMERVVASRLEPSCAVLGGAKVADKIRIINNLKTKFGKLLVAGGMTASFVAARGMPSGDSDITEAEVAEARRLLDQPTLVRAEDVVVRNTASGEVEVVAVDSVREHHAICDIGPQTRQKFTRQLLEPTVKRVVWNGPVGIFEDERFETGTKTICKVLASLPADTLILAGGGSTVNAVRQFGIERHISHLSTAGGAFLEYLEGKKLPGFEALGCYKE